MAYSIPNSILQHQHCSVCKRYLSCPPTKIYRNGEIKCGRCSEPGDGGSISTIETLAKHMLFPCINRFDGCIKTLHYLDVKEHEKNCHGTLVQCPICSDEELTVLCLIHHFKIKHPKNILSSSVIDVSLSGEFTQYYLKCDFEGSRIFVVGVNWDSVNLVLDCATIVNNLRKTPSFQVTFFAENDDEVCLHLTDVKYCLNLKQDSLFQESFSYKVPLQLAQIRCTLDFDYAAEFSKTEHFFSDNNVEFKKTVLPKMYLDSEFKEKYKDLDLVKFKFSPSGQKLVLNNYSLHVACDFCQKMFAYSGFLKEIYYDHFCYICGTCYSRGITKSLANNKTDLSKLADGVYYLLNFYCKFGCKKFFRSGELLSHEDQCILNKERFFTENEYVSSRFGDEYIDGSKFSWENVIIFEPGQFEGTGKIFIATKENFKCVIDYQENTKLKLCIFHVNHKYDAKKYYICVHKWENGIFSTDYNDFSMKTDNCVDTSLFAINLKEVEEDLEVFYDV